MVDINIKQKIIKSPQDNCNYEIKILKNGLETLLISDATTETSYVAMIVNTGSLMENDTLGLAHFLEHMLFMGNEKYPEGSKYFEYVNAHGGMTNAFTELTHTCYYFSINNEYLETCIDMFGHFFIDPLFNENLIGKEINAVNSEYQKNINLVPAQILQALKLLVDTTHPFKNFTVGSTETLNKDNIRNALITFYKKYYVVENMKLIILNNKPNKEIEKLTEIFSNIDSGLESGINGEIIFGNPLTTSHIVRMIPTSKSDMLLLFWAIPIRDYKKIKMLKYIFYLLGRESNGTLAYLLVNNSLIEKLQMIHYANLGDYMIICLETRLTKYGYFHMDVIFTIINNYIELLLKNGLNEKNFKSYCKCMQLNFLFEENKLADDKIMDIVDNVCHYNSPLHDSISLNALLCEYNCTSKETYIEILNYLRHDNCNIVIGSPRCILEVKDIEKWFHFKYSIEENQLYNPRVVFKFENVDMFNDTFVPEKLIVYKNKESFDKPIKLDFPFGVWYKYENISIPKVCVILEMTLPFMFDSVEKYVGTKILLNMIKRKLRGVMYDGILCNTVYDLYMVRNNLFIKIYGFNDKIEKLLVKMIDCLLDSDIHFASFTHAKDIYMRHLENKLLAPPYSCLHEMMSNAMYTKNYTVTDKINACATLKHINLSEINLMKNTNIKCLINGNITKKNCIKLCECVSKLYGGTMKETTTDSNLIDIKNGTTLVKYINTSEDEKNVLCCVVVCIEKIRMLEPQFDYYNALNLVTNKLISDKFFSILRTQEQLGYIVKNNSGIFGDTIVLIHQKFYVQTTKYTTEIIFDKIEKFFVTMQQYIRTVSDTKLNTYIEACITNIMIDGNNLIERTNETFIPIADNTYDFAYKNKMAAILRTINIEKIIAFYDKYFVGELSKKVILTKELKNS